jgi:glycosyltransferase involved in cell wall biosynthesis
LAAAHSRHPSRRALLLYLNEWWNPLDYWRKKSSHQNLHQAREIAQILQGRGYACDVAHYKNKQFTASVPYDVIISHRFDDAFLRPPKPAGARYLCLTTTQPPQVNNTIAHQRREEVCRRRGGTLSKCRDVSENLSFLRHADGIASFGDESVAEGWRQHFGGPIRTFNNWPFSIPRPKEKDWARAKSGFLFLASGSQVHKGLDLVLEAIQELPEARLYVCSYFKNEKDFCALYRRELFHSPNVFPIGLVNIRSAQFQRILADTAFAIMPSASDACPGSIVQAGYCGLVPVLSRYCGVAWPEAIYAEALTAEAVRNRMKECLAMSVEAVQARSGAMQQRIEQECSRAAFRRRWEEILDEIVGPVDAMRPPTSDVTPHA